jgi:hypothetical protein
MRRTILVTAIAALATAAPASAHRGDIWFGTAAGTAKNIEAKFSSVSLARCWPLPVSLRSRYDADSYVRGGVRRWDHFECGLAIRGGRVCLVVAHMTGREWDHFVLTSYPHKGCSPYELRR